MKSSDFIEALKDLRRQAADQNWGEVRDEWQTAVEELIREIRGWLSGAEEEDLVQIKEDSIRLEEDFIGETELPRLRILFPGMRVVTVKPVARLALGSKGRVDIEYGTKSAVLLRDSDGEWGLRVSGKAALLRLDGDTFLGAVTELIT